MAIDKNLFLYDLAIVAIMKNEGPYAKEWIEYHLLAGVNHFYIYDNDSPDNLKEVLNPYIERGIITYHYYPGKARQYEAYNEAVQNYRFQCRYMAFIDGDEFIFPQSNRSITEVVDEVLADKPNAGALAVNWINYGSNFQDNADYSRGVIERFTRHAPNDWAPPLPVSGIPGGNAHVKTIANPRRINYFFNPHFAVYFEGYAAVNENGNIVPLFSNNPPTINKIRINHYPTKSREEYAKKVGRGTADAYHNVYKLEGFNHDSPENEVFDDSILKYVANRFELQKNIGGVNIGMNYQLVFSAMVQNLSMMFVKNVNIPLLTGRMETFLACRAIAANLRNIMLNDLTGNFFEELALNAVHKTLFTQVPLIDMRLLISELPNLLPLNYASVKDIRKACITIIPQIMNLFRVYDANAWREFVNLKYLTKMLQTFDVNKS